jgi:hypothetical protein
MIGPIFRMPTMAMTVSMPDIIAVLFESLCGVVEAVQFAVLIG